MSKKKKLPRTDQNSSSTSELAQLLSSLRESEKRYRSFIENFQGIAYEADAKTWTPIFFHGAVEEITGYREEDFTAGNPRWNEIIHPDDFTNLPGKDEVLQIPDYSIEREYRIIHKDGQVRWVRGLLHNVRDETGEISLIQGTIYDITEKKQIEEALRESEKEYRNLVESALIGVATTSMQGEILYVNDTFLKKMEYESLEELAKGGAAIKYKSPKKRKALIEELKKSGRVENFEVELLTKSGKSIHFLENCTLDGDVMRCMLVDITERKQTQRALKESEQSYRTVADFTYDWEYWTGPDGKMRYVSPSCKRITGYTQEEFIESPQLRNEIITPETLKDWEEHKRIARRNPGPQEVVFAIRHKDGGIRWIEHVCQPVIDEQGNSLGSRASNRDITIRKHFEEKLQQRTHDLGERVKELNCLYQLSRLIETPGISLEEVFQGTVDLIPSAWQYPEITCARLTINDHVFKTKKFKETKWKLTNDIVGSNEQGGSLEVFYLEERPEADEGPFMKEEKDLINAIGEHLGGFIQRRQVEEALLDSVNTAQALVNAPTDGVLIIDLDTVILEINETGAKRFNKSREELIGTKASDLVPPELADNRQRSIDEVVELRKPVRFEDERQDLWHENIFYPVIGKDGKVSKIAVFSHDITERKRAEEALKESESLLRKIAENYPHSYLSIIEKDLVIGFTSGQEFQKQNIDPSQFVGARLDEVFGDQADLIRKKYMKTFEGDEQTFELIMEGQYQLYRTVPLYSSDGSISRILSVVENITERKQAEEEIHKLNEELEQRVVERTAELEATNKELEAFAYSISHDLRAPLRAINSFSSVLKEKYAHLMGKEGGDYLDKVMVSTLKMDQLINDLLALSRLGRQEFRRTTANLSHITHRIFKELASKEPDRDIQLVISDLPLVKVDVKLIEVMMNNLLSNAVKFTRDKRPAVIELGCVIDGEMPTFYLRDNGVGFDMKYAYKLFTPFQRLHTEREFEGTGIGLAIVQRIVNRHGGEVWVEAKSGKGATVYFTLE